MADKPSRGLPESVKQGFNFSRSAVQKPEQVQDANVNEVITAQTPQTIETTETIETPKNKGGRPKGAAKVKKTFYLASGVENLKAFQIELVKRAGIFIKDESEVADLALAVLHNLVTDEQGLQRVLEVRKQLPSQ